MSLSQSIQRQSNGIDINYKEIDVLEKEFQQILSDLADDQSLLRFKQEYQKLYRALKRSHDNQKILYNKITELSRDMANQTARIRVALRLSQEDAQAISFLKQQLQKTFKVLELSKEREERSKQKIEAMNCKIKVLQGNLQQRQALSTGQSNALNELKQKKDQLLKQKQELNDILSKIKIELSETYEKLRHADSDKYNLENNIKVISKQLYDVQEKLKKDEGRKVKIQDELDNLERQREGTTQQTKKFLEQQKKLEYSIAQKKNQIDERKAQDEALKQQNFEKIQRIRQLKQRYFNLSQQKSMLHEELSRQEKNIDNIKKQLVNTTNKNSQLQKNNDKLRNTEVFTKEGLLKVQRQNEVFLNSVTQLQRQIADRRKLTGQDQSQLQQLQKSRNLLQKELLKLQTQFKFQMQKIGKKQKEIGNFQTKISETNLTLEKLEKEVQTLEKDKQKYGKQAALANSKYLHSLEQIKLKGNLISEYQKKNIQTQNRLKQQQRLYEQVRSDRNTYSKNLSETEDQIAQIKRRYKIVNHQINQLKEQIDAKEVALAKEHFQHKKKDKTIQQHSRLLEKHKKDILQKQQKIKNFHGEISKLHFIIKDSENQRTNKKQEYQLIVAERDILGTQLIRRNDQSALLYQKIKIQQTTLAKGETAYRERIEDIQLLDYKKSDLKRQLKLYMKEASKIPEFKNQIYNTQNQLIEEKLKVKALSQELQNPLNAQRIRPLEGSDPDTYEMKQKIKTLQKRLIFKTEQVVEKEVLIHQKEKQVQQLREIMKRQPGLEQAEKISILQRSLNIKTRQMKALAAEINMYQAQMNEYKYDIEKTTKEIQQIKRKYNEQKKREELAKDNDKILQS